MSPTRDIIEICLDMLAGGLIVAAIWILPDRVERFFTPEEQPIVLESPYITAPGNRIKCPDERQGLLYSGWIATQSDGFQRPFLARCVYLSREEMRGMR